MSNTKNEKKIPTRRKLSLNRETLRVLSADRLGKVAGGLSQGGCGSAYCTTAAWTSTCQETAMGETFVDGASEGPYLCPL